jgi:hypothetical protein
VEKLKQNEEKYLIFSDGKLGGIVPSKGFSSMLP